MTFGPICAFRGFASVDALLENKYKSLFGNVLGVDRCGRTALMCACESAAPVTLVEALLAASGPTSDHMKNKTANKRLSMHLVCTTEDATVAVLQAVYSAYPEAISTPDENGHCPLHLALVHGCQFDVVNLLLHLDGGVKVAGLRDALGRLPLHLALEHKRPLPIIQCILSAYSEASTFQDDAGDFALHTCSLAAGIDYDGVLAFVLSKFPEAAQRKNHFGHLPLHRALDGRASTNCLRLLLDAFPGAVKERDMRGRSPLSAACEHGEYPAIELLLAIWPEAVREHNFVGQLPLHVACCHHAPLKAIQLILSAYPIGSTDCGGDARKLPLILAVEHDASVDVVSELLPLSIQHILAPHEREQPQQISGKTQARVQCGWTSLLRDGRDAYSEAVAHTLDAHPESVELLALTLDEHGRRAVDIATPLCKGEILKRLFLCGRFEIKDGPPLHMSGTSRVHYAIDHDPSLPEKRQVVLKFMKNRDQWEREILQRQSCGLELSPLADAPPPLPPSSPRLETPHADAAQYIVPLLGSYAALEDKDFARQLQTRGFASHPFLLVMAAGDRCLAQIIDHEREVPDWYEEAVRCARQVASSLAFFHSRGSIHGDLKPRNIVRIGTRYFLIDFDASAKFGESAGSKRSTAFSPPELLEALDNETDLIAAPSFDAWGLGVMLFHLITGQTLLHADASDNAADDGQLRISRMWTNEDKDVKLSRVPDRTARNLLSLLLHRSPNSRPQIAQVLQHPFLTGKEALRLPGEEAAFDVFISYRVASDRALAENLFNVLTAAGARVWFDVKCLQPGESWEDGFCSGLAQSSIFIPILSRGAIKNFSQLSPTSPFVLPFFTARLYHAFLFQCRHFVLFDPFTFSCSMSR